MARFGAVHPIENVTIRTAARSNTGKIPHRFMFFPPSRAHGVITPGVLISAVVYLRPSHPQHVNINLEGDGVLSGLDFASLRGAVCARFLQ
jgi:hypothetical protein